MQVTDRNLKLCFLLQNFNVLFTDFKQSHVDGIVSKVVRKRDKLEFWFTEMIRVKHLTINSNRISSTEHRVGHSDAARLGVRAPLCISESW